MRWRRRWLMVAPELQSIMQFLSGLAGPRWLILRILGDAEKTTSQIYEEFMSRYGIVLPRSLFYYHLSELERMGLIEMVRYQETGKGGAPEKVWRLKVKRIVIDIVSGVLKTD